MRKYSNILLIVLLVVASFAAGSWHSHRKSGDAPPSGRRVLYYVDPMNPTHTSETPGLAPCGMKMEPVYADEGASGPDSGKTKESLPPGTVKISLEKQQMIGVKIGQLKKSSWQHTIRTLGRAVLDETRVFRVAMAVDGLVRKAGPIVSGNIVRKGEVLATFYNRDFLTAQQTYLYALNTMDRFMNKESEEQLKLTKAQMRASEENLEFLGMGETQIEEIARTRQIAKEVELRSPVAGLVLARNAFPGLRFDRGTELFRIADLSHVWVLADIFEEEAQFFRPGISARVYEPRLRKTFDAKVSDTLPQFDAASRSLQVRLEVDNPDFTLRPDMYVDVELTVSLPSAITVPADALIDTGLKKIVYVCLGDGYFEPRQVDTGWRLGRQVEITGGLMVSEEVVVSGNFLIDSESHLRAAAAGIRGEQRKDPVCGMYVDEEKTKAEGRAIQYEGQTYFFCSGQCKANFEKDPKQYIAGMADEKAYNGHHIESGSPVEPAAAEMCNEESRDPVCGMAVDEKEARAAGRTSEYEGRTYFFCCDQCKKDFERDPNKCLEQKTDKQMQSGNPAVPADVKDERMQRMGEPQESQANHDRLGTPAVDTDIRVMKRKRGGTIAGEPVMPVHEMHEQQNGGAIPDQPNPPGPPHD